MVVPYELRARIECADGRATDPDHGFDLGGYRGYGKLTLDVV